MSDACAIIRVLKDDLIGIFAGCLSPAAGRGNTGLSALPLTGGPWWYGRAGGTLEDAGMWASSPHTTQSGSAGSGWGPTCACLFSLVVQPACCRAIRGLCPPASRSLYAAVGWRQTAGSFRDHGLSGLVPDRHLVSLPSGDREGWDWLYFRPGRPADQVLSGLGARGE